MKIVDLLRINITLKANCDETVTKLLVVLFARFRLICGLSLRG